MLRRVSNNTGFDFVCADVVLKLLFNILTLPVPLDVLQNSQELPEEITDKLRKASELNSD